MSWTVKHNPLLGIIEVTLSGLHTATEQRDSVTKRISVEKETGTTRTLIDASEVEEFPSVSQVIDLPSRLYPELGANRTSHIAFVLPVSETARESVQFLETACVNRGWNLKTFPDRKSALDWLTDNTASNKLDAGDKRSRT